MLTSRHLRPLAATLLLGLAVAPGSARAADAVTYYPRADGMPFSEAVRVGNQLVLTSQLGLADDNLTLIPGGFDAEAPRAMVLIGRVLAKHGLGYDDITSCTVLLTDIGKWEAFNHLFAGYFKGGHYPARMTVGVAGLPRGAHVGVACQAAINK